MNDKKQWITYQLRQLGWKGKLGMLFFLAAIFLLGLVQASMEEVRVLSLTVNELQSRSLVHGGMTARTSDIVKRFYAVLPAHNELNQKVSEILNAAENGGLTPLKSAYLTRPVAQSRMSKCQIKLPLVGRYQAIRKFITDVMNAQPTIALSDFNFRREDLSSNVVNANVEFILYTKADES